MSLPKGVRAEQTFGTPEYYADAAACHAAFEQSSAAARGSFDRCPGSGEYLIEAVQQHWITFADGWEAHADFYAPADKTPARKW